MKSQKFLMVILGIFIALGVLILLNFSYTPPDFLTDTISEPYHIRTIHSRDGIGKFYMGREIAKVMGHQEMLWLERPSRVITEQPDRVIEALNLKPTDIVADIGAGTGYFSFRIAPFVSQGQVLAIDIQPEMLEAIEFLKAENDVKNVRTILGTTTNPNLANDSIDLVLMVDTYHELEYPKEMMEAIFKALKPGGRVVLVEYRRENPLVPIKALHKMTQKQVKKEMESVGLRWQEIQDFLPEQHLIIFEKNV